MVAVWRNCQCLDLVFQVFGFDTKPSWHGTSMSCHVTHVIVTHAGNTLTHLTAVDGTTGSHQPACLAFDQFLPIMVICYELNRTWTSSRFNQSNWLVWSPVLKTLFVNCNSSDFCFIKRDVGPAWGTVKLSPVIKQMRVQKAFVTQLTSLFNKTRFGFSIRDCKVVACYRLRH